MRPIPHYKLTGKGILIGFLDIDYRSPIFRNIDGPFRIVGIQVNHADRDTARRVCLWL